MSHADDNRKNLDRLLTALGTGTVIRDFAELYDNDVAMLENGVDDPARVGLEKNLAYESYFMANAEWHGVKVGPTLVDGDHTAYEMWMDISFMGNRMQRTQFALQTWKNNKIVREVFYYKG